MKKLFKYIFYFIVLLLLALIIVGNTNTKNFKEGELAFSSLWQGKFIDISGEKIRYIQKGKGRDILLIHGTPGSIEDWQSIIDSLATKYRVTAYDRTGHGFSTATNYTYTIKENVAIANQLINKLALDSILVVGHSYGGSIAANMAATTNDKVESYIIIASPLYQFEPDFLFKLNAIPLLGKGITTLISKTIAPQKIEEGLVNAFGGNKTIITDTFLNIRKQLWSQAKVLQATSKERINYDSNLKEVSNLYKKITKKVTILYGTNDDLHIQEDCIALHKDIPTSELIVIKNVAHYVQFEKPNTVINTINAHIMNPSNLKNRKVTKEEKVFFFKNEINVPTKNNIYTSTKNEVILFRPTEFDFGLMVEDNQSDALVALDGNFEELTNTMLDRYKNNKKVRITISEKPFIAVTSNNDTLYLDASKHKYGIVINALQAKPIFLDPNQTIENLTHKINTIFNLK